MGITHFFKGFAAAIQGINAVIRAENVRKTYRILVVVTLLISLLLDSVGIWGILELTGSEESQSWLQAAPLVLLRYVGIVVVLLVAPVLALLTVNLTLPVLSETVFFAGLSHDNPELSETLKAKKGLSVATATNVSIRRVLRYLALSFLLLCFSFVPLIGPIIGPGLQAILTCFTLGWELLDPYLDKLKLDYEGQRAFLQRHRFGVVGFALPFTLILPIPLLGPLCFGWAQAATGIFVARQLHPQIEPKELPKTEDSI